MSHQKMTVAQGFVYYGAWFWILANVAGFVYAIWATTVPV